jgi:nitrile hydratase beta subunit-like protein
MPATAATGPPDSFAAGRGKFINVAALRAFLAVQSVVRLPKCRADPMPPSEVVEPRFQPGDRVAVRAAYPVGHVRTPFYVRGKSGVVERLCGAFPDPEERAYARSGLPRQPLYRVRFRQNDVWSDYCGQTNDAVEIEIYQHWLEPAP